MSNQVDVFSLQILSARLQFSSQASLSASWVLKTSQAVACRVSRAFPFRNVGVGFLNAVTGDVGPGGRYNP